MARRVFFSFHYDRDVRRVSQVRNSWIIRAEHETQPFLDKAEWESIKRRGKDSVSKWIEEQLRGTSVTVVLIGAETSKRAWVLHEIERSHDLGKGMLGVYIHNVKDPRDGRDAQGNNPFRAVNPSLSHLYKTYDWVNDDGYNNLSSWVEAAARAAGR